MRINHNLMAMNTHRQLGAVSGSQSKSMEKLSSGYRINRAGDDAAGLAISEKMRGQIRGLDQASRNAQDGISLIQTAEGALTETHSILQRMRELSVQAANGTNTDTDRNSLQEEINQLTTEIDRIANTTEFNTKKLLNGDLKGATSLTYGSGKAEGSFANGSIVVSGGTDTSLSIKTEVFRIKIVQDISTGAVGLTDSTRYSISSILGSGLNALISSGNIVVSLGVANTTIGSTTASGDMTFTLTNIDKLRAGDVITVTLGKFTNSAAGSTDGARMQIGANAGQEMEVKIGQMTSKELEIRDSNGDALKIDTQDKAASSIEVYNLALQRVSKERSNLGALQNRLEHTINNLDTSSENLQSSESRIRDVDMAKEMMNFTKNNILQQAAQAMLAQANQAPQGVLQLLG